MKKIFTSIIASAFLFSFSYAKNLDTQTLENIFTKPQEANAIALGQEELENTNGQFIFALIAAGLAGLSLTAGWILHTNPKI